MTSHRARRPARGWSAVGLLGELFVTAGLLLLLFVAWELWWTDVEAGRASSATTKQLTQAFASPSASPTVEVTEVPDAKAPGGLIEGKAFGLMRIPRLGADWVQPIHEGTDLGVLQSALGHYNDTAGPGAVGNFAVAGHRTTWGRPFHDIDTMRDGDVIVVETRTGYDVYEMTSHEIVAPTAVEVIAPVPNRPGETPTEAMLTLTACHPKFSAAQRYVVHARLVRTYTRDEGLPASVLAPPTTKAGG